MEWWIFGQVGHPIFSSNAHRFSVLAWFHDRSTAVLRGTVITVLKHVEAKNFHLKCIPNYPIQLIKLYKLSTNVKKLWFNGAAAMMTSDLYPGMSQLSQIPERLIQIDGLYESSNLRKIKGFEIISSKFPRPRWPSGKISTSGPHGRRLETRFHRRSAVYGARCTLNHTQWPNALPLVWRGRLERGRQLKSRPRLLTMAQNYDVRP
ncbi:hypothetical protein AVEN_219493-1 [Araneus ventricosus]|uniref:Uncharacterized protein n=1 Tax=Araneus ventricosus TaxID=182803 RepID=A0A4Y2BMA7_ARAVE|nr:hypothetical protein AVEN_219493-1 [Araneus ventricosus]